VKTYRANGKLLISGEYTVLDGSLSLALPTQRGQELDYEWADTDVLHWRSLDVNGHLWFEAHYKTSDFSLIDSSDTKKAAVLKEILLAATALSSTTKPLKGEVTTRLEFPNDWGLGSSSTLLCCVAQCFEVNALDLHFKVSNGSGYDVACGLSDTAITYRLLNKKTEVLPIDWKPSFKDSLFFIYLNTKQKSSREVSKYQDRKKELNIASTVSKISKLTQKMIEATTIDAFNQAVDTHEEIMSIVLGYPTVKALYFADYPGSVKSLGAWGGDFILATGGVGDRAYFTDKGYTVAHEYASLIIEK
jgi:mevalonate kinase|tara:strand:- start:5729 stop:6640 length:912 start_codon:yes stop_codon:yes gene_type:complete